MITNKQYLRAVAFSLIAAVSVAAFQNCSKPQFAYTDDNMLSSKNAEFALNDTVFKTEMNIPVQREINYFGTLKNYTLSLSPTSLVTRKQTPDGVIEITNAKTFEVKFTPQFGFRGHISTEVFASDKYGNKTNGQLKISVGNSLSDVKPALAIRGAGCVSCHASIESNFVTDMGAGDSYFLGRSAPAFNAGHYGFHDFNGHFKSIDMNSSASILLPKIDLPADYKVEDLHKEVGSASTLGHLIEKFLPFSPAARSHSVKVEEKSKVFIGVPTVLQIKSAFRVTNEKLKFIRENNTSPDLKGITSKNGVFTNSSVVICDGDLYLDGLAYFNNLRLVTTTGCRIYSTGSVFIYGPISYVDKQADSNIQILSAHSIQIGLGSIYKENKVCETTGWFAEEANRKAWSDISHDSLILRQNFGIRSGLSEKSRSQPDGKIAAEKVLEDYAQVTSNFGKQDDASCRPEGRNVGFDHIMLIAPSIHSRYQGNINGSLVAETALMALGQFKFAYDPVFDRVPIFPFIDHDQYLVIE